MIRGGAGRKKNLDERLAAFKRRCRELGLASTHQRQVIYSLLAAAHDHPSPEAIYDEVRRRIPSISLGTVYKNIKIFVDSGLVREVSPLHQTLRLDANLEPHHHLVCSRCKKVEDLACGALEPVRWHGRLPNGFRPERAVVEVIGLCAACSQERHRIQGESNGKP